MSADLWSGQLGWWISAVELPTLAGLAWMVLKARREQEAASRGHDERLHQEIRRLRDEAAAFQVHVAQNYASTGDLKDVELRLTEHLVRIEAKLDHQAVQRARAAPG